MVRLPDRVLKVLEKLVKDLSAQEPVSAVGFFGSWSRGDAVPSSDADLLIVSKRDFDYEYVERLEFEGLLVDLNYIPKSWITGPVPPEIDQKLYEVNVLYDRDWSLTNTKDWMSKTYRKPERVDIRTEAWLVDSDMYVSRAASASARGDFQSACLFAGLGMECILKIPVEVSQLPISNSHFIEALQESLEKMEMFDLFTRYIAVARLAGVDQTGAQEKLDLFGTASEDVASLMKDHPSILDSLHSKVKAALQYYGKPALLRGMVDRTKAMIDAGASVEAAHYVLHTLADMIENYAWLASAVEGVKLNYTTLFRSLRGFKKSPARVYKSALEAFNIGDVTRGEAEEAVKSARETTLSLRQRRKQLIRKFIKPPA